MLTTGAARKEDIDSIIKNFLEYNPPQHGAIPLGIHLEGPYLNPHQKGAQPEAFLRTPHPDEYQPWFDSGVVKMMTIAPELPGAMQLIKQGRQQGVEFAAGHSTASYQIMMQAVDVGLRQASHTFNSMEPFHHRHPGVLGAVLSDPRIFAQIIPDGVHVHPAVVRLLVQLKGIQRTILITDAMRAAGLEEGKYELLGQDVYVSAGEARLPDGTLAGSVLTMDQALRNMMDFCDLSLVEAVHMASTTPADSFGLIPQFGSLQPGGRADIVVMDEDRSIEKTLIGGRIVYSR